MLYDGDGPRQGTTTVEAAVLVALTTAVGAVLLAAGTTAAVKWWGRVRNMVVGWAYVHVCVLGRAKTCAWGERRCVCLGNLHVSTCARVRAHACVCTRVFACAGRCECVLVWVCAGCYACVLGCAALCVGAAANSAAGVGAPSLVGFA